MTFENQENRLYYIWGAIKFPSRKRLAEVGEDYFQEGEQAASESRYCKMPNLWMEVESLSQQQGVLGPR